MIKIPDLAYFIGRPFEELTFQKGKKGAWAIHLGDGAVISNKDANVARPDEDLLAGTSFIRPVFSELDTRLQFGVADAVSYEIILTPTKYTISDPAFTNEDEIYPQAPPEITTPPDPSDERVAEGPEEDEMSEQERELPDREDETEEQRVEREERERIERSTQPEKPDEDEDESGDESADEDEATS